MKYAITGGPGCGKTTIIQELEKRGHKIIPETARLIIRMQNDNSDLKKTKEYKSLPKKVKTFLEKIKKVKQKAFPWEHIFEFQRDAARLQLLLEKTNKWKFADRGLFDGIAYLKLRKLKIPKFMEKAGRKKRYDRIFILAALPKKLYVKDKSRKEDYKNAIKIENKIKSVYRKLGYKVLTVPYFNLSRKDSIKKRVEFILKHI